MGGHSNLSNRGIEDCCCRCVANSRGTSERSLSRVISDGHFQCVPEKLPIKRTAITELDQVAPPEAIIASNSSSYGISEVIEGLKLKNLDRAMSAHCCESNASLFRDIALK